MLNSPQTQPRGNLGVKCDVFGFAIFGLVPILQAVLVNFRGAVMKIRQAASDATDHVDQDQTESGETVREAFMRVTSGNPRFVQAKPSGMALEIIGVKPPIRR